MTIWKFPVEITDEFELEMPSDAKILSVQMQNGSPQLWALVDPKSERVLRTFYIVETGNPICFAPSQSEFVGTFQTHGGQLVRHLFAGDERTV